MLADDRIVILSHSDASGEVFLRTIMIEICALISLANALENDTSMING
jgi:hypothetical protein